MTPFGLEALDRQIFADDFAHLLRSATPSKGVVTFRRGDEKGARKIFTICNSRHAPRDRKRVRDSSLVFSELHDHWGREG